MATPVPPMPREADDPFGYAEWVKKYANGGTNQPGSPPTGAATVAPNIGSAAVSDYWKSTAGTAEGSMGAFGISDTLEAKGASPFPVGMYGGTPPVKAPTSLVAPTAFDWSQQGEGSMGAMGVGGPGPGAIPETPGMVYAQGRSQVEESMYHLPSAIAPPPKTADPAVITDPDAARQWSFEHSKYLSQLDIEGDVLTVENFERDYAGITGLFGTPLQDIDYPKYTIGGLDQGGGAVESFDVAQRGQEASLQELITRAAIPGGGIRTGAAKDLFEGFENLVKAFEIRVKDKEGVGASVLTEEQERWILFHELSKPIAQGGPGLKKDEIEQLATAAAREGYFKGSLKDTDIGQDVAKYRAQEGTTGAGGVTGVREDVTESIEKQMAVKINFKDPVEYGTQMQNMFARLSSLNASVRQSGMETLAEVTAKSPPVPEGYDVTRDSQGQPILSFVGIQTGTTQVEVMVDGEGTGEYRQEPILSTEAQYQLPAQVLAQYQQGMMLHEQAVGIMTERSAATLGLDIKEAEAQIVREEFRMELQLAEKKFGLSEREFESNESLQIGSLTGIFTDADGNEISTLSEREFLAKMTGTIDTGTMAYRRDETGKVMQVPISADTVEMQKLRADLSGIFEGQGTITKQQVDAALTGYLADKGPTFAREQWEEAQSFARNEALTKAGVVAVEGLVEDVQNWRGDTVQALTAQGQALVDAGIATKAQVLDNAFFLKSIEAQRQDLTEKIEEAKLSGLVTIPVMQEDGQMRMETVKTLEQERNEMDKQRLTATLAMETAQKTHADLMEQVQKGMSLEQARQQTIGLGLAVGQERREQLGALGYGQLPGAMVQATDTEGRPMLNVDGTPMMIPAAGAPIQSVGDPSLRKTLEREQYEMGVTEREQRRGLIGGPEGAWDVTERFQGTEFRYEQAVGNYTESLRASLNNFSGVPAGDLAASQQAITNLSNAVSQPIPNMPAGFYWDSSTGSMQQRAGYEGAPIDADAQRVIEILGPAMRQRDRAEAVLNSYNEFHMQRQQTEQMHADSTRRLREALNSTDIETAEEYAFIKQREEAKQAGYEATHAKYQTVMQLLSDATLLGLARRHGILAKIEGDLGITLPHIPMIGSADYIPTPSEWLTMNPEERSLRTAAWAEESGSGVEAFHQLIGQNVPAQIQQTQYATLG